MSCYVSEAMKGLENAAEPHFPTLRRFTYVTAHSTTLRRFTYVTAHSTTLPLLHLRHRNFTYFTWRAAHVSYSDIDLQYLPEKRFFVN